MAGRPKDLYKRGIDGGFAARSSSRKSPQHTYLYTHSYSIPPAQQVGFESAKLMLPLYSASNSDITGSGLIQLAPNIFPYPNGAYLTRKVNP